MENDTNSKKIPKDFNWKLYIKLNDDLIDFNNKKAAIKHYIEFGKNENRQFKIDIPSDFNWRDYIKMNGDLKEITNKKDAIYHYTKYGFFENRKYKKDENRIILYDLFINNMIDEKDNLFFILSEIIKKNIKNVFIDNFVKSNISFYEKTKLLFPNIIYSNICNDIQNNLQQNNNETNDILKYSNMDVMLNSEDKNKAVVLDYKFVDFANIYDSFIVIFDLPENFYGGTKFFINSIIEKYRNKQDFLILCTRENKSIKININNQYYFNTEYNENLIIKILELMKHKIKKIFINHTYGFSKQIINYLFTLNKKVSTITHDHYLFNDSKTQLMYYEINEYIYKNDSFKHDFSLFDNIITQNKKNLYLFKNMSQLDNIVVSELPDFKISGELINTNNKHIIVGIIGYISDIKGSDFIRFLIKIFKKSNIKIVIFGKIANSNYKHCYSYNNVNELNELLKTYKPNMLLECSLWPETYSYTLSLSILTDLPILILKRFFSSVIDNRIKNYKKKHYFNNIYELLFLINTSKQNYFKTIKPIIYFNKFWDKYFSGTQYNYENYIQNNKTKIQETYDKNIILITSKIYVSNVKFSYLKNRSVYSSEERFKQTLVTISTIKERIPDYFIVLFDNSNFTEEETKILNEKVNCFINIRNNKKLDYYTNKCEYKYLSDLYQQINSYYYFLNFIDVTKIKNFFKISGRYYINNQFDYSIYDNNLNIFKKNLNLADRDYYYTSFFKISKTFFSEYFIRLNNIFKNKYEYFDLDLEVIYGKCFLENMTLVNKLGITQLISCWPEISNI